VLAVGARMGALMPMSMLRPQRVFAGVGDAFFSILRATREFMFAGSERLRFRRPRLLRFGLRGPVNVGDVLACVCAPGFPFADHRLARQL
jgi:hypothetical protein